MAPRRNKENPDWDSPGMDLFEQAMHLLDAEAKERIAEPEAILLAMSRAEHCYYILFVSLHKHLPKPNGEKIELPKRHLKRTVVDNLRDAK